MISILVVDSNPELCDVIVQYLSLQQDYLVLGVAYDGKSAIELAKELRPDLILLDLGLPLLDGLEVLDALKGESFRVLVITAFAREEILQTALKKGASYCLVKPFYLSILDKTIKEICISKEDMVLDKNLVGLFLDEEAVFQYIDQFLYYLGIKPHLKGYAYIREALSMSFKDKALLLEGLTKSLYPSLAKKFLTSTANVEAAIRGALESAWRSNCKEFRALSPNTVINYRPTNAQFLNLAIREISRIVKEERKKEPMP